MAAKYVFIVRRPANTPDERRIADYWYMSDEDGKQWVPCRRCAYRLDRDSAHLYAHGTPRLVSLQCEPIRLRLRLR